MAVAPLKPLDKDMRELMSEVFQKKRIKDSLIDKLQDNGFYEQLDEVWVKEYQNIQASFLVFIENSELDSLYLTIGLETKDLKLSSYKVSVSTKEEALIAVATSISIFYSYLKHLEDKRKQEEYFDRAFP